MPDEHICDRNGRPVRVDDDSREPPIAGIYPTCSVCGKPQVFGSLLSQLRGQDIGAARNALPACRADSPRTMTGAVETPDLGLVKITFSKVKSRHGKTVRWFWSPESAELER